jgi:hypothetical protein
MSNVITLSDGTTTITLSPDLQWVEQFSSPPVSQQVDRSITGAVIVQAAAQVKGAAITLQPVDDSSAWMTLATVGQILVWAGIPLQQLTLTMTGQPNKTVIFRHQESNGATAATPVVFYADPDQTDNYLVTIRLMEI